MVGDEEGDGRGLSHSLLAPAHQSSRWRLRFPNSKQLAEYLGDLRKPLEPIIYLSTAGFGIAVAIGIDQTGEVLMEYFCPGGDFAKAVDFDFTALADTCEQPQWVIAPVDGAVAYSLMMNFSYTVLAGAGVFAVTGVYLGAKSIQACRVPAEDPPAELASTGPGEDEGVVVQPKGLTKVGSAICRAQKSAAGMTTWVIELSLPYLAWLFSRDVMKAFAAFGCDDYAELGALKAVSDVLSGSDQHCDITNVYFTSSALGPAWREMSFVWYYTAPAALVVCAASQNIPALNTRVEAMTKCTPEGFAKLYASMKRVLLMGTISVVMPLCLDKGVGFADKLAESFREMGQDCPGALTIMLKGANHTECGVVEETLVVDAAAVQASGLGGELVLMSTPLIAFGLSAFAYPALRCCVSNFDERALARFDKWTKGLFTSSMVSSALTAVGGGIAGFVLSIGPANDVLHGAGCPDEDYPQILWESGPGMQNVPDGCEPNAIMRANARFTPGIIFGLMAGAAIGMVLALMFIMMRQCYDACVPSACRRLTK